jgi:alginate O-acetyltransferase complex protein AlgI
MIFTSLEFLAFFVILLIAIKLCKQSVAQIYLLLVASYVFYGAADPRLIPLLAFSSFVGWWFGNKIHQSSEPRHRTVYLTGSIVLGLGILAFFKYSNFFAATVAMSMQKQWVPLDIVLPVGISFFTFQNLSYTIDIYRKKIAPCDSLTKYLLFVAFFPQLVAGPIVRASQFLPQLDQLVKLRAKNLLIGCQIFLGGAIQKVLFADNLSSFVDYIFSDPSKYSGETLWLAMFAYSLQIFCDFSGYSLMAIGTAYILGFTLPENFRMPYISRSITEFWRRWHISLSTWLRDYLYISLGGNRRGEFHTMINLFITMLLGGLWHGANWNFVAWGALHGVALIFHKYWIKFRESFFPGSWHERHAWPILSWGLTLLFCCLLWIPFRAPSFEHTVVFITRMFTLSEGIEWIHPHTLIIIFVAIVWHILYVCKNKVLIGFPTENPLTISNYGLIFSALLLILMFSPLNTSPFVYFQF